MKYVYPSTLNVGKVPLTAGYLCIGTCEGILNMQFIISLSLFSTGVR